VPTLIIIAGPNGAGKTTFAREYLSEDERSFEFVKADEIAGDLASRDTQASLDFSAARSMLRRVEELIEAAADFVVETTLANLTYAQKIPAWRRRSYLVSLVYLRPDSVEHSIARVRKRVAAMTFRRIRFGGDLAGAEIISRPFIGRSLMSGIYGRVRKARLLWSTPGTEDMSRGLDFEKAQAALRRAAEKAMRGTREERSGRFEPVRQRQSSTSAKGGRLRDTDTGGRDKWRKS
jgi:hypothetical protein